MTNGEKMKQIFPGLQIDEGELYAYLWLPCHDAIDIPLDWWNEEYKEPTTKNNLGVTSELEKNSKKLEKDFGELDCISRKAVLDAIDSKAWEFCDYLISKGRNDEQKPVSHFADNLRECVRVELPSVTPKQRIGKWIDGKCNRCGTHAPYWAMATTYYCSEYCPNCGCRMVEPQESEYKE